MSQYLLVDGSNIVQNVILWDGAAPFTPPAGQTAVSYAGSAPIGGTWTGSAVTPPSVSVPAPQAAATALAAVLAAGIAITCTGDNTITGTYALDPATQQQVVFLALNGLPGGATNYQYPKIDGTAGSPGFTAARMTALAHAIRDYVALCYAQAGIAAHGGSASYPSNAYTIA